MSNHSRNCMSNSWCEIVLSNMIHPESIKKQTMQKILTDSFGYLPTSTSVLSGSMGELLSLNKPPFVMSDIDQMCVRCIPPLEIIQLNEKPTCRITKDIRKDTKEYYSSLLCVHTHSLPPGYYHIGCFASHHLSHKESDTSSVCLCSQEQQPLVDVLNYKQGVSTTPELTPLDVVHCLPCQWSDSLKSIFSRSNKGWPSAKALQFLKAHGRLFLVQKAHPLSRDPDIEFRVSFSVPEVILARSLPDALRHTYLTVRLLCYNLHPRLKTFHLKTILFWLALEHEPQRWSREPRRFAENVALFFSALVNSFNSRRLPHFFIPQLNILDDFKEDECKDVVQHVHDFRDRSCCLLIKALQHEFFLKPIISVDDQVGIDLTQAMESFSRCCMAGGDTPAALQATRGKFEKLLKLRPANVEVLWDYGRFLHRFGDSVTAHVLWLNALVLVINIYESYKDSPYYYIPHVAIMTIPKYRNTYDSLVRSFFRRSYPCLFLISTLLINNVVKSGYLLETSLQYLLEIDFKVLSNAQLRRGSTSIQENFCVLGSPLLLGCLFRQRHQHSKAHKCFQFAMHEDSPYLVCIATMMKENECAHGFYIASRCRIKQDSATIERIQLECIYASYVAACVHNVCAAVAEYVRYFYADHQSGRRHSISSLGGNWMSLNRDITGMNMAIHNYFGDD